MNIKKEYWIVSLVVLAFIGVGIYLANDSTSGDSANNLNPPAHNKAIVGDTSFLRPYSHATGSLSAPVTLVEFGDFGSQASETAYPAIKTLRDKYANDSNFSFVFRNLPSSQLRTDQLAASAAESAGAQNKYFEMHDLLFDKQNEWALSSNPITYFTNYAKQLGLNLDQFNSDTKGYKYFSNIDQDIADASKFGVSVPPIFYIVGGNRLSPYAGVADLGKMVTQVDSLMKAADAANGKKK